MNRKEEFLQNDETIEKQSNHIKRLQDYTETFYDRDGKPFTCASMLVIGKDFIKSYREDLFRLLGVIGNAETQVLLYILNHVTYTNFNLADANTVSCTYSEIEQETGISRPTIAKVFKKLKDCNAITKISGSKYRVNPNLISIGTEIQQQRIMIVYNNEWLEQNEEAERKYRKNLNKRLKAELAGKDKTKNKKEQDDEGNE